MVILASFLKRDKQRFLVKDNQTNAEEAAAAGAVVANRSFFLLMLIMMMGLMIFKESFHVMFIQGNQKHDYCAQRHSQNLKK